VTTSLTTLLRDVAHTHTQLESQGKDERREGEDSGRGDDGRLVGRVAERHGGLALCVCLMEVRQTRKRRWEAVMQHHPRRENTRSMVGSVFVLGLRCGKLCGNGWRP
jgi:hypothetical protein